MALQMLPKLGTISIHAPRTGSDMKHFYSVVGLQKFQSTLPARGATYKTTLLLDSMGISIHAPRTGSDNAP